MGSALPSTATSGPLSPSSREQPSLSVRVWAWVQTPWQPEVPFVRAVCALFAAFMLAMAVFRSAGFGTEVTAGRLFFAGYGLLGSILAPHIVTAGRLRFYTTVLAITLPVFALYVSLENGGTVVTLSFVALSIICPMIFLVTVVDLAFVMVVLTIGHGVFLAQYDTLFIGVNDHWMLWLSTVAIASAVAMSLLSYRILLKRSERELETARDEALAASQAKSELLANMSDEIRTPLNGIVGFVDLLLETELSAEQRRYLEMVAGDSERLMLILNDLLDLSKMHAHKLELEIVTFNLPEVLRATLTPQALRAEERGLDLVWETSNKVPMWVKGDPHRLRQLLGNLVDNAVKFTHRGEVSVIVRRAPGRQGREHVQFTVRDTGVGMSAAQLRVARSTMESSTQRSTHTTSGSHLGLAVCAQLAGLMSGRLTVDSEEGRGTTFTFTARLPADREKEEAWAHKTLSGRTEGPLQVRVLLVEDNATNRIFAERILQKAGHAVVTAENGQVALERFAAGAFDIVFMDMQMPVMDGLQAARAIRKTEQKAGGHVPIVALTAHVFAEQKQQCIDAGMDMHLGKPIHGSALLDVIHRLVDSGDSGKDLSGGEIQIAQQRHSATVLRNQRRATSQAEEETRQRAATASPVAQEAARAGSVASAARGEPEPVERADASAATDRSASGASAASAEAEDAGETQLEVFALDRLLGMIGGDRELIIDMLGEFVTQRDEITVALRAALDAGDTDEASKLAHKLKGSLLALCADASADTAKDVEIRLREGELAVGRELFEELERRLATLMDELRAQELI